MIVYDDSPWSTLPADCLGADIDYGGKAIIVGPQNGAPEIGIIDCQGGEGNPHLGFRFHSDEGSGSVLEGVTMTNGCTPADGGRMRRTWR